MNKKGFTLIELIAIIIIVSIIMIVSFSSLTRTLKKTKLKEVEDFKTKIATATQIYVETELMRHETFNTGTYMKIGVDELLNNGYINDDIEVADKCTFANTTILAYKNYDKTITYYVKCDDDYEYYTNGMPIYFNPTTGLSCTDYVETNSDTGNTAGCMKWYTFNDTEDSNTINLILDHNTTAKVAWNLTAGSTTMGEVATALTNNISLWASNLKTNNARLITADEIAKITGANRNDALNWNSNKDYGTSTATQSSWFYLDGGRNTDRTSYSTTDGWQKQYVTEQGMSEYLWLFDRTNSCTSYGCINLDNSTYGYWTSTIVFNDTGYAWAIGNLSRLNRSNIDNADGYGVRPVITISKDLLQ